MSCDLPCISYMALYIVSMHVLNSNSRTSTHWKLNADNGKVQDAMVALEGSQSMDEGDPMMSIITNRVSLGNGEWRLEANPICTDNCLNRDESKEQKADVSEQVAESKEPSKKSSNKTQSRKNLDVHAPPTSNEYQNRKSSTNVKPSTHKLDNNGSPKKPHVLTCGKAVNSTQYDYLPGISERASHPLMPEPEVALIFKKNTKSGSQEVDMNELEKKLRRAKKDKPKSPLVYNQIGNFWRIRGDTQMSIECFRKALYLSPNNSDVLLNLARVLFNLQYLHDARILTHQSLDTLSPDQNSWLQHYTLGEIFKAMGKYGEASIHFRHTLDMNPGFQPAMAHLREMEINPDGTVTYYTLFIILFLVLGVLCGILTSVDGNFEDLSESMKTQRHFNRAMAMRSMKLGINHRMIRMRKQQAI